MLREMGLAPLWRLRARDVATEAPQGADQQAAHPVQTEGQGPEHVLLRSTTPPVRARGPVSVSDVPASHPADGGQRPTRTTQKPATASAADQAAPQSDARDLAAIARMDWDELEQAIARCTACELCKQRNQSVPGMGDRQADWVFIGEGPGAEEDRRGLPFVGPAGRLLDEMLKAIGLARGDNVYIANAIKCRPPFNRTPTAAEIDACRPFLMRQLALLQPKLLVALGRPAAQALLKHDVAINAARGKVFQHGEQGTPLVVTYHPAYLLRNPEHKRRSWADLCHLQTLIEQHSGTGTDSPSSP